MKASLASAIISYMDETSLLIARFRELSDRAYKRGHETMTGFLSLSEQNVFFDWLKKEGIEAETGKCRGSFFAFLGGHEESDRKILLFSPDPLDSARKAEIEKEAIACLLLTPKSIKYADRLTHRDYLGAMMNLGYERKEFGDILTDGTLGYLFLAKPIAEDVKESLVRVKHTPVSASLLPPGSCPFVFRFQEKRITLAHNRIDAIIKEAFDLSRRDSQEKIGKEEVFVDGRTIKDNSYRVKAGQRISVRGKGKFIYIGDERETRKNRIATTIKIYC